MIWFISVIETIVLKFQFQRLEDRLLGPFFPGTPFNYYRDFYRGLIEEKGFANSGTQLSRKSMSLDSARADGIITLYLG